LIPIERRRTVALHDGAVAFPNGDVGTAGVLAQQLEGVLRSGLVVAKLESFERVRAAV
jgi:hypothetical protein